MSRQVTSLLDGEKPSITPTGHHVTGANGRQLSELESSFASTEPGACEVSQHSFSGAPLQSDLLEGALPPMAIPASNEPEAEQAFPMQIRAKRILQKELERHADLIAMHKAKQEENERLSNLERKLSHKQAIEILREDLPVAVACFDVRAVALILSVLENVPGLPSLVIAGALATAQRSIAFQVGTTDDNNPAILDKIAKQLRTMSKPEQTTDRARIAKLLWTQPPFREG